MKKIRISCACFARIEFEGKYLLIQNKKMKSRGVVSYSPIGGALEYTSRALPFLDSINTDFEKGKDLRIHIPKENYEQFKTWFLENKNRERSVFREMKEEMVDEENFLSSLLPSDITEKFSNCIETTQDWDVNGVMETSYYFFEVFDVSFNKEKEKEILDNLKRTDKLFLFTPFEIKNFTDVIAGSGKYILP